MRFEPIGSDDQQAIIDEALARCTFPFAGCDPDRVIPVEWGDLSRFRTTEVESMYFLDDPWGATRIAGTPHSHDHDSTSPNAADPLEVRGRVLGLAYYSGKVAIDLSLEDDPEVAGEVFLSEAAHMVDFFCMVDRDRLEIWNALHAGTALDLSEHTDVKDAVDLGHGHSWFDVGGYYSWVGEAWMGLFVRGWSDFAVTIDFPDHPPADDAVDQVRRWFTPEPTPTPPDVDPVEPVGPGKGCAPLERVRRWFGTARARLTP